MPSQAPSPLAIVPSRVKNGKDGDEIILYSLNDPVGKSRWQKPPDSPLPFAYLINQRALSQTIYRCNDRVCKIRSQT